MERTGWKRACYTVAVLAAVLVPLAAATAVWSIVASGRILNEKGIDGAGTGVARLGPRGFAAMGVVCWGVVAAAARWRNRPAATAVAAVALVAYIALCMAGVFDALIPFVCDISSLT